MKIVMSKILIKYVETTRVVGGLNNTGQLEDGYTL